MEPQARALYEKIAAAYVRDLAAFVPAEYPTTLLEQRLTRFLPRLPFFCTESYAARPVYRDGYLVIEDVLRIGPPKLLGIMAIFGWFFRSVQGVALSPRGESFTADLFGGLTQVHEREWQLVVVNPAADDPLDGPPAALAQAAAAEYHAPEDGFVEELYVSPFFASLYIERLAEDSLAKVLAQAARWKILVVGTSQRGPLEALRDELAAARPDLHLGELRPHYLLELPSVDLYARYAERARRAGHWPRLLFDGRLHEL